MDIRNETTVDVVWIVRSDTLPDTCCDCGCFTDHRVTVKHVDMVSSGEHPGAGITTVLLTLVFHVALGPVGWLVSALLEGGEDENGAKTVKKKSKIKISQCRLCHGMQAPIVVDSHASSLAFKVHPKFKQGIEELREE